MVMCLIPVAVAMNTIENIFNSGDSARDKFRDAIVFMVFAALISSLSLVYLVKRIHWLLVEKDEELRKRSLLTGEDFIKNHDDSQDKGRRDEIKEVEEEHKEDDHGI